MAVFCSLDLHLNRRVALAPGLPSVTQLFPAVHSGPRSGEAAGKPSVWIPFVEAFLGQPHPALCHATCERSVSLFLALSFENIIQPLHARPVQGLRGVLCFGLGGCLWGPSGGPGGGALGCHWGPWSGASQEGALVGPWET